MKYLEEKKIRIRTNFLGSIFFVWLFFFYCHSQTHTHSNHQMDVFFTEIDSFELKQKIDSFVLIFRDLDEKKDRL